MKYVITGPRVKLLLKHKYIKRYRGKDGKWRYVYPKDVKGKPKKKEEPKDPEKRERSREQKRDVVADALVEYDLGKRADRAWYWMKVQEFRSSKILDRVLEKLEAGEDPPDAFGWSETMLTASLTFDLSPTVAKKAADHAEYIAGEISSPEVNEFDILQWAYEVEYDISKADYEDDVVIEAVNNDVHPGEVLRKRKTAGLEDAEYRGWGPTKQENVLATGKEVARDELGGGTSKVVVLAVESEDGDRMAGVWKPQSGEHGHLRTEIPTGGHYIREAAAYELDKALGLDLVPTTVIAEQEEGIGSIQEYLPGAQTGIESDLFGAGGSVVEEAGFLDFLMWNTDRHEGNYMYDADNDLRLIDNGLCFPTKTSGGNLRSEFFSDHIGEPVDDDLLEALAGADLEGLCEKYLEMGMDLDSVNKFYQRVHHLLQYAQYPTSSQLRSQVWEDDQPLYSEGEENL